MARRPGRVTGKAARRSRWYTKRRNQWIAAGLAVLVLGAGGVAIALNDSSSAMAEQSPGDQYKSEIIADFGPMSQSALNYLRTINEWRTNKVDDKQVDAAADLALIQFLSTRDLLRARAGFPQAPRALTNYQDSVELYIVHARLAKLGVQVPDDKLNRQIQLSMGRVRYLADRLYDLGSDELTAFTTEPQEVEGMSITRAVDVPSFAGTDLAPGPPLALARPGAVADRQYEEVRPESPFSDWQTAVEAAKIPTAEAEVEALREGTVEELNTLAERLTAASDQLHATPDPMDERELSTRVQLGLLVQAEAMRAAQVSRLVPEKLTREATEISQVLALLGNAMWDPRLGARETGLPASLVTERPAVAPPPAPEPTAPASVAPDPTSSTEPSREPTTAPTTG